MSTEWRELEELVYDRFLEELVAALRRQVPDAPPQTVVDSVQDAMIAVIRRDSDDQIDDLRGYLFTAAKRMLVRTIRRDRSLIELTDPSELPVDPPETGASVGDHVAQRVDSDRVLAFIRSLVATWESDRMRTVIEIYLDGIEHHVGLQADDVREVIADSTGALLSKENVWKLKQRGFARLARQLDDLTAEGAVVPLRRNA